MNRRVIAFASLIAAAVGLQAPVAAQDHYIAPAVVYTDDDRKRAVDDEITGGQLAVGTFIADNFALEGILGLSSLSGVDDLDLREIGINGRYVFRRDARLSPYLVGGFGLLDADSRLFDTEQSAYLTYGFGIDIRFGDGPLSLRLETRMRDSDEEPNGFNDHITSLGVAYAFGPTPLPSPAPSAAVNRSDSDGDGVRDDLDQCPDTPAGYSVDSRGCALDSDRDGVADAIDECPATVAGATVDARGCELDGDDDGVVDRLDECPDTVAGARVDNRGCEIRDVIDLPGVTFETNSDRLLPGADDVLNDAAATLRRYPELVVEVAGHTDSQGAAAYNQSLSERRANTVRNYLVNAGANGANLTARGYGEAEPVAPNDTAVGRAQNRRVELRIIEQ